MRRGKSAGLKQDTPALLAPGQSDKVTSILVKANVALL